MVNAYLSQIQQEQEHTLLLFTPTYSKQKFETGKWREQYLKTECSSIPENGVLCFQKQWGLSRWLNRNVLAFTGCWESSCGWSCACESALWIGMHGEEDQFTGTCQYVLYGSIPAHQTLLLLHIWSSILVQAHGSKNWLMILPLQN